jgi:sialidase-1
MVRNTIRFGWLALTILTVGCSAPTRPGQEEVPTPAAALVDHPPYKLVFTNAGGGGYEAFPDVCRTLDGRLVCVFYEGYAHVSPPNNSYRKGGRICASSSLNNGETWSPPTTLYDGPYDDRDPSIAQLRSGRLLCDFFSLKPEGTGYADNGVWIMRSDDRGRTWSRPQCVSPDYYCSSPVRELSDGTLVLGLYTQTSTGDWGAVVRSRDGGVTWGPVVRIDNNGMPLNAETDVIELADGSLFAAERSRGASMGFSRSFDRGMTWSPSLPLGFAGNCPYLHRATNGIVLLGHRLPGTSLHYSIDDCQTWSQNVVIDDVNGAYPSMADLSDGTVLVMYYDDAPPGSDIRARRFRVTANAVEWLPIGGATTGR